MNIKLILTSIIIIGLGLIGLLLLSDRQPMNLAAPNFSTTTSAFVNSSPSPSPSPDIPTFKFDSQTDLKAELEKVNPEVTDEDFN